MYSTQAEQQPQVGDLKTSILLEFAKTVWGSITAPTPEASVAKRKFLRFMVTNLFNLSYRSFSRDAQPRHHPAGGVLQHVAMQQPVAGIVGDEGYLNSLAAVHQNSVAQWP